MAERDADQEKQGFKPPKNIPPPSSRALQMVVNRYAEFHGVAPNRVQRWIAFMALGAALRTVTGEDGAPVFMIKGGVSLEMRLRLKARATKDFDATFSGEMEVVIDALERAFAEHYEGFAFRIAGKPWTMKHMHRFEIKVEYRGRVWSSVTMEISRYEGTPMPAEEVEAISLADFGLRGPRTLPCMPLIKQVAQKIHAMTEVLADDRPNERFRDLVDLWVLRGIVLPSSELREVCEETFRIRRRQPWPPEIAIYPAWPAAFAALAQDLDLPVTDIEVAAADVREYLALISAAFADTRSVGT
jgi:hypothetical protein